MKPLPQNLFDDPGEYRLPHLSESVWSHLSQLQADISDNTHDFESLRFCL